MHLTTVRSCSLPAAAMISRGILLLVGIVLVAGCKKEQFVKEAPEKVVRIRQTGTDFKMPSELWDKLLPEDGEKHASAEEDDENIKQSINFAPLIVTLTQKNSGILTHSPIQFEFPQGGGMIDLAEYVTRKPGTFYVNFDVAGMDDPEKLTIYFLSRSKKRRFDNQIFGSGCRSFFNIKKHVLAEHSKYGIAVNTTRNLHTTTLGGNFLLSWKRDDSFLVTQVQFFDSKNPQLFCEDEKKENEESFE